MPTIAENAESMAALVAKMKRDHKLTENTIMRIIDMNFALAQSSGLPAFSGNETPEVLDFDATEFPEPDQIPRFDLTTDPDDGTSPYTGMTIEEDDEEDSLATAERPLEN